MWTSGLHVHMHTCVYTHTTYIYAQQKFQNEMSVPIAFVCVLTREAGSQVSSFPELMKVRTDLGI